MFRTSYVYRQEDCIVRAALYGTFAMRLLKVEGCAGYLSIQHILQPGRLLA
jgi:hypothetical protein